MYCQEIQHEGTYLYGEQYDHTWCIHALDNMRVVQEYFHQVNAVWDTTDSAPLAC